MKRTRPEPKPGACGSFSRSWIFRACLPLLLTALLLASLTGCGGSSSLPPIQVDTVDVTPPPAKPKLPEPEPILLVKPDWEVIVTEEGPMLALTEEQFQILATNLAEILRWIREAAWRLDYYGSP